MLLRRIWWLGQLFLRHQLSECRSAIRLAWHTCDGGVTSRGRSGDTPQAMAALSMGETMSLLFTSPLKMPKRMLPGQESGCRPRQNGNTLHAVPSPEIGTRGATTFCRMADGWPTRGKGYSRPTIPQTMAMQLWRPLHSFLRILTASMICLGTSGSGVPTGTAPIRTPPPTPHTAARKNASTIQRDRRRALIRRNPDNSSV